MIRVCVMGGPYMFPLTALALVIFVLAVKKTIDLFGRTMPERERLIRERTAHINRIKGLLSTQGIRNINVKRHYKTLVPADLVTGDGRPLPERLAREIVREIERLALLQVQLREIERERDSAVLAEGVVGGQREGKETDREKGLREGELHVRLLLGNPEGFTRNYHPGCGL